MSQDDSYWWQARREGDRNMRAGLIPSRALQERRIIIERQQKDKTDDSQDNLSKKIIIKFYFSFIIANKFNNSSLKKNQIILVFVVN